MEYTAKRKLWQDLLEPILRVILVLSSAKIQVIPNNLKFDTIRNCGISISLPFLYASYKNTSERRLPYSMAKLPVEYSRAVHSLNHSRRKIDANSPRTKATISERVLIGENMEKFKIISSAESYLVRCDATFSGNNN